MQAQLHVDLSDQHQHTIERSSGNYSRFLLWCAIFAGALTPYVRADAPLPFGLERVAS